MAVWLYSSWITETDASTRLEQLRLHIAEVSQHVFDNESRSRKVGAVSERYLGDLMKKEAELEVKVNQAVNRRVGINKVKFADPTP